MVDFMRRVGPVVVASRWFHDRPRAIDALGFAHYLQCRSRSRHLGFVRRPFHTKVVDLERPEPDILAGFKQRTRNGVRQAERAGVRFEIETDRQEFLRFHDDFARRSGLAALPASHYVGTCAATVITKATHDGRVLAMHSYVIDARRRRARLLQAPCCAPETAELRKLLGIANRFLFYADMLYFRGRGIAVFDFGGYALGTDDPKLQGINDFKDRFGGEIVEESNYASLPLHLAVALKGAWRRAMATVTALAAVAPRAARPRREAAGT